MSIINGKSVSLRATAAISAKEGYLVKVSTSAENSIVLCGAGELAIGVIEDNRDYAIGDAVPISARPGDIVEIAAGGAIIKGDKLKSDANGAAVAASAGENYVAIAMSAGSFGKVQALLVSGLIGAASLSFAQGTTGSSGTAGQIAVAGMTAAGIVIVTLAEDPGTSLVLSDVVVGVGLFTVYTKNTDTNARAALSAKLVNYLVLGL